MTSSAYFMSKSVFDQQGCRALTFAFLVSFCHQAVHFGTDVNSQSHKGITEGCGRDYRLSAVIGLMASAHADNAVQNRVWQ